MLSTDSGANRTRRRPFDLVPIAAVFLGLAMLVVGVALFYRTPHLLAALSFDPPGKAKIFALAVIVLAVLVVGATLRPALRSLRPLGIEAAQAGSLLDAHVSIGSGGHETSAANLIALKLSEPGPGSEMALSEAVRRAYQQSETTAAACFANTFASGPDDIAKMYATFIAEHVPIYGCKRPSSAVEQVFLNEPLKEFEIEGGSLFLRERHGEAIYHDLRIRTSDYPIVLARLHSAE